MMGRNITTVLAALLWVSACGHAASRPEVGSDDAAPSQALRQLRPPGGFMAQSCATRPALCFVSNTLINPATTDGATSILATFGVDFSKLRVSCTPAGIYADASGKNQSMQCEGIGNMDHYSLAITVCSLARAPRNRSLPDKQTSISFTVVRVLN